MLIDQRQYQFNFVPLTPRTYKPLPWPAQRIATRYALSPSHALVVANLAGIGGGSEVMQ